MEECLRCGRTSDQLLKIARNADSADAAGWICTECENDLVWGGIEVGAAGTCGYSENCNRTAVYVTLEADTLSAGSGEAMTRTRKRNNILCENHFNAMRSE